MPFGHFWPLLALLVPFIPICAFLSISGHLRSMKWIWNCHWNMIFLMEMRGLPNFYNQRFVRYRFWPVLARFGPFLQYLVIFEHFRSSERYEIYETLIEKWCFRFRWGVNQVFRRRGSRDIGFDPPFGPFYPILTHFGHFMVLLVIWDLYNVWNTNRKVGLAVILRGQTSFYDQYFVRYGYFRILLTSAGGTCSGEVIER